MWIKIKVGDLFCWSQVITSSESNTRSVEKKEERERVYIKGNMSGDTVMVYIQDAYERVWVVMCSCAVIVID